jgi:PAS domain-containing protein
MRRQAKTRQKSRSWQSFIFDHMPIALWRVNSKTTLALLQDLRRRGVIDLGHYLDQNPDVVYEAMNGTRIIEANRWAVQLFGARNAREMLGPVSRFWKNGADSYKRLLETQFNGKESPQVETQLTTLDSRTIQGLYFYLAFPRSLTAPGASLYGFVDETERLRAQSRLAAIVSSSTDAIVGKTLDGIVTSWNTSAERIFGYDACEIIGESITRIIPPELQQEGKKDPRTSAPGSSDQELRNGAHA